MIIRVLITILVCCPLCLADDAYSWKDKDGRSFYGTTPPKNALEVERVPDGNISSYNGEKAINITKSAKRARLQEPKKIVSAASLSNTKPACVIEESKLVQCSLSVENTGDHDAKNVRVQLQFTDGTSIPLSGPTTLLAKAKVLYIAPESLLPLALDVEAEETPEVVLNHE